METETKTIARLRGGPYDGQFPGFWDRSDVHWFSVCMPQPDMKYPAAEYRRTAETEDGLPVFRFAGMVDDPHWPGNVDP